MKGIVGHPGPHLVYLLRDADGKVLYVGRTVNLKARLAWHRPRPWFAKVASVETQTAEDFGDALAVEKALIIAHDPPHNLVHTSRYARWLMDPRRSEKSWTG